MQYILSILLGALLTLSFAPWNWAYILPFAIGGFIHFLHNSNTRGGSCLIGYCFGIGHFSTSLHWIVHPLTFGFSWLIPIAITFTPLLFAIYFAILGYIYSLIKNFHSLERGVYFAASWVVLEYIRSFVPIPFAWNLLGYTSLAYLPFAQFASIFGVYGLSFIITLLICWLYSKNILNYVLVLCITCSIYFYGYNRLNTYRMEEAEYEIRIVQPNIANHFGDQEKQLQILKTLINLSRQNHAPELRYIIWPEAIFPWPIYDGADWVKVLGGLAPQDGYLVIGADRYDPATRNMANSMVVINDKGKIVDYYDKMVLVPFGEYIPLRNILSFLREIAYLPGEFEAGTQHKIVNAGSAEFVPMICYEATLPNIDVNTLPADWLLNITNDSWFKNSIGTYHHFSMSRLRAIEYGMPMIRVATTGISALISPVGQVMKFIPNNKQGILDFKAISAIPGKTLYSNLKMYCFLKILFLSLILSMAFRIYLAKAR